MGSHVDCSTLDRYAETVVFISRWGSSGYKAGFGSVVLLGASGVREPGREWVPARRVVFLEMHCLLFRDAGAAAAHFMVARTIALACCAVVLAVNHYIDDLVATYLDINKTAVEDLKQFVKQALPVHFQEGKFRAGSTLTYIRFKVSLASEVIRVSLSADHHVEVWGAAASVRGDQHPLPAGGRGAAGVGWDGVKMGSP